MSGSHFGHFHPEVRAPDGPVTLGTFVYAIPAGWKLCGALALVVATTLAGPGQGRWLWIEGAFLFVYAAFSLATPWVLAKRFLMLAPFLCCVLLAAYLRPGGLDWRLVAAKSVLCLSTLMLLAATTPFGETLRFLKLVRTPALLVTTMALMGRYLFVLSDEMVRMRRARTSRTFVRSRRLTWKALSTVGARLFVRASERADRIYDAMCSRGWH